MKARSLSRFTRRDSVKLGIISHDSGARSHVALPDSEGWDWWVRDQQLFDGGYELGELGDAEYT